NVYVAHVAMGADPAQLIKAVKEAEEYDGPSVVIAYTPCASHGICIGMHRVQEEMKRAVESGYWLLYRYDPRLEHPFQLDSKAPTMPYKEFLAGEVRYNSLTRSFPTMPTNSSSRAAPMLRRDIRGIRRCNLESFKFKSFKF
ncbi:MAG: pyruvate:ferredoxin (flavodoxin) oxidoreductase, partial [Salinivirgaceae bacterium]|nr:pyruvate:ferredoxin (flavodoxin) oxidoreductase [Salinivirgaceae bacterium]